MKKLCYILLCGLLTLLASCEKDTMAGIFAPEVTTGTATNIYRKGATLSGSIRFSEGTVAEHYGILFSELQSMSEYKEMKVEDGATDYNILVQDLEPGKTYYFCSYAHSGYSLRYGEVRSFTTPKSNAPVFDALVASSQTVNSFKVTATLLDDGGSELIMVGFCYNEFGEKEPTFLDKVVNVAPEGDSFSAELTGLAPGKQYQVRVYGASENGLAYSDILIVSTEQAVVPYLSSISCQDSTATSIIVSASVIDAGTSSVKELGFCYSSESQEPTKESHKSIDLSDQKNNDVFSTIIGDLIAGTTYYIRAYAVNTEGISYSDAVSYMPRSEVPTLSEISCQDSTATTITVKASVLTEGTSAIKSVGFCYSTESQEPTKELHSYIELPSHWNTAEEFIGTLEGLESNTTYYVRAYAENSEGIGYSESISYTPYAEVPTLSTVTISNETPTSITVSASVLDVGTSNVNSIGFCYKVEGQTSETIVDLSSQLGNESFSSIIGGLEPGTTYIIRAYAENDNGISYSEEINYTTREPGIYSLEEWREFCINNNQGLDLAKWKNKENVINLYADIELGGIDEDVLVNEYVPEIIAHGETLNGNGHIISGFRHYSYNTFVKKNEGVIINLHLGDGAIVGTNNPDGASGFCLENSGTIIDCSTKMTIVAYDCIVGGICARNLGTIIRCVNRGRVFGRNLSSGIANGGIVEECENYGNVYGLRACGIGGDLNSNCINYGIIGDSYMTPYGQFDTAEYAAGIVVLGSAKGCTNEGKIIATKYAGGVVAELLGEYVVEESINKGDISSEGICGGIIAIIRKTSSFDFVGGENTNGGSINGIMGDETNAVGYDERQSGNLPPLNDMPIYGW